MRGFIDALQPCVTVFERITIENDVTTRSVNHFDDDIQLTTQNNIIFQTLFDCYINCTVYNDLQLFYKEKFKKRYLLYPRVYQL